MAAGATDARTQDTALLRTFLALELPADVRDVMSARQAALRAHLRAHGVDAFLRWSDLRGLHLTLRFLGETTPAQCAALAQRLAGVVATAPPFRLALGNWGAFPQRSRPRVLWVGVGGETALLAALQAQVEAAVQAIGFPAETKPFAPHITLARIRRDANRAEEAALGRSLAAYQEPPELVAAHPFMADHLTHFRSDLQPRGAVYTVLCDFALGAAT